MPDIKIIAGTTFAGLLAVSSFCPAAEPAVDRALHALQDGIPEVAITLLEKEAKRSGKPLPRGTALLLARSQFEAGRPADALATLDALTKSPGDANDEERWLTGQSAAAAGDWARALESYRTLQSSHAHALDAAIGEATALRALGDTGSARALFKRLLAENPEENRARLPLTEMELEAGDPSAALEILSGGGAYAEGEDATAAAYLEGRIMLAAGKPTQAERVLATLPVSGLPPGIQTGAVAARAQALAALGREVDSENLLEEFIDRNPDNPRLDVVFEALSSFYMRQENPSQAKLREWTNQQHPNRSGYAHYHRARVYLKAGDRDRAISTLVRLRDLYPEHAIVPQAMLQLGELLYENGEYARAVDMIHFGSERAEAKTKLRERLAFTRGLCLLRFGDTSKARDAFVVAMSDATLRERALFNVAMCHLADHNYGGFVETYKEFSLKFPESPLRRDLLLEEGLMQAAAGSQEADASLGLFVRDFHDHPSIPEARLALAEIDYRQGRPQEAESQLQTIANDQAHPETATQAAYLALFTAPLDTPEQQLKTIEAAEALLASGETPALAPKIRLRLGELYYRRENFANARTQFELAAAETKETEIEEKALFLAGSASMKTMNAEAADNAIKLFDRVVRMEGSLRGLARREQADLLVRSEREEEALVLYRDLAASNASLDLKCAAVAGEGEAYFSMAADDPKFFNEAIARFDQLAANAEAPSYWRSLARWKKGQCHERMGDADAALASYYEVIESAGRSGKEEIDLFWLFKSGFDAARLLEKTKSWKSAIETYSKLASHARSPRGGSTASHGEAPARTLHLGQMTSLWWILIGGLLGLGLAGCVLPFLPGTLLIFAAAIVHRVVYGVEGGPGWVTLVGLGLLAAAATVLEYLSGAAGARYFGSTKAGIWGAILGGIVGLFFSLPGLIIGPIVGAIAGELLAGRKAMAAGRAGLGTALGGAVGILIRLAAGIAMTVWFLFAVRQVGG